VAGQQDADGWVQPEIVVPQLHADEPLMAARREVAAALIDAAEDLLG
jgi:hypothetical protein